MTKQPPFQFTLTTLLLGVFLFSLVLAAFCRGDYLLGRGHGILFAICAALVSILVLRASCQSPLPKFRLMFLAALSIYMSLAFTFPSYLNSDLRHFVVTHAVDRQVRGELATLFASDPAFHDLRVSTVRFKILSVQIHGSVPSKTDLDRLRSLAFDQCQAIKKCYVEWDIHVRNESKR